MNDNLCIEYAKNREELNNNRRAIAYINREHQLDLSGYRENYYKQNFNPLYDSSPEWKGWVTALKVVGDYIHIELDLAVLLDKKKEILRQAGIIKRRIAAHGRGLINKSTKDIKR